MVLIATMKLLRVNKNLLFLILFPVLGIIVFSIISINNTIKKLNQNEEISKLIQLSFVDNALVHQLQKERGLSYAYVHSQGKIFNKTLFEQRKATDIALVQRQQYIHKNNLRKHLSLKGDIQININSLADTRAAVDGFSVKPADIIIYFSTLNQQLIDTIFSTIQLSNDSAMSNLLHAYYYFAKSKEYTGVERALLANVAYDNCLNLPVMKSLPLEIVSIRTMQHTHFTLFKQFADKSLQHFYQQAMTNETLDKINSIRKYGLAELSIESWFNLATEHINQLHLVENEITERLLIRLNFLASDTKNTLIYRVVFSLLSLIMTLFLFFKLSHKIAIESQQTKELAQQKETLHKFKLIVENTLNSVVITNPQGRIEYVNKHFAAMSGYRSEDVIGSNPRIWSSGNTGIETYNKLYLAITKGKYWQGELQNRRNNGELYWAKTTIFPVKSVDNEISHFISIQSDITQQKHDKETVEYLANYDELTGLPSLRLGKDRLEQAILSAQRHNLIAAIMFIDLDGFKQVNDDFGHSAGDEVLKVIGQRIVKELRQTDTVARIGGDEFIVIMTNVKKPQAVNDVAEKIINSVKQPIYYNHAALRVSASIGIAQAPLHGIKSAELLNKADKAMYKVKKAGKNNFAIYQER